MSRLPWREDRQYRIFVASPYKKAFLSAAGAGQIGIADNPDYEAAKYGNDVNAALRVVHSAMNRIYVLQMKMALNALPEGLRNPILVAPYKAGSPNMLARAAAIYLGDKLGLEVDHTIVERPGVSLKTLGKLERMFNSPDFEGDVQRGRWYIAVDDVVSSGTTMASLRSHIVQGGGRFLCGCALASPSGENVMLNAPKGQINEISAMLSRGIIEWFEKVSHVALDGLTKSEADFLRRPEGRRELADFAGKAGLFQS